MVLLIVLLLFTGCSKKIDEYTWSQGHHQRSDEFLRVFDYSTTQGKYATYSIIDSLSNTIDLNNTVKEIENDIQIMIDYLKIPDINLKIFIMDDTTNTYISNIKDTIYIPYSLIKNKSYRPFILSMITDYKTNWKVVGLCGVIFKDTIDTELLHNFYSSNENLDTLLLNGASFYTNWTTESNLKMVNLTAIALTNYIIDNYTLNKLNDIPGELIRKEWLTSLGLSNDFDYSSSEYLDSFFFYTSDSYDLIAQNSILSIFIDQEKEYMNNYLDVYRFINILMDGKECINSYMKINAPKNYSCLKISDTLNCYIGGGRSAHVSDNNIYLLPNQLEALLHEYTHAIIDEEQTNYNYNKLWVSEGIAEYMSRVIASDFYKNGDTKKSFYDALSKKITEDFKHSDIVLYNWYNNAFTTKPSFEEFNMRYIYDNLAYQTFVYPNDWLDRSYGSGDYETTRGVRPAEGTELSMLQSMSFVGFLINEYSLDYVISYLKDDVSFISIFGEEYTVIKDRWMNYLSSFQ